MSEPVFEAVLPRPQFEKRKSFLERLIIHTLTLYSVSQQSISSDICPSTIVHKRSGRSVKVQLKESTTEGGHDAFPESQMLKDLRERLVSFNGEEQDPETHDNKSDTLQAEAQKVAHKHSTCTYVITVFVQICDVVITSQELVGFVNITVALKHSDYSYLFTSDEEIIQEHSEQTSGSKIRGSTPRMVLKVIFRKCPNNFNCTSFIYSEVGNCRLLSRAEKESKSNETSKANPRVGFNEEVLAYLIRLTLNDFSGTPSNYNPVELSPRAGDLLRHLPYISIAQHTSDRQEILRNTSFTESLFSFLTWPLEVSTSAYELAVHGFTRDNEDGLYVKCRSCGVVVNVTESNGNNFASSHTENYPECKSSIANALSTKGEENDANKKERKRHCDHNDDIDEDDSTRRTDSTTSESLEHVTSLNVQSIQYVSSERLATGEDADDNSANQRPNSLDRAEGLTEAVENTQSAHSDVTSEADLLEIASGGIGRLTYTPRNLRYASPESRRLSFRTWIRPHENIDNLVDSGFFSTGEEDVVRCFHCDIGLADWNPDDDPWVEHARHSPDCPYLRSRKDDQFINNIQLQWAKIYTPKHPHMSSIGKRNKSYETSWPRDFVLQTPYQLAEAGFFYTGETDTVRCHYCDGGLREWEPNDDPWTEHARWFPFCKFVIKVKGLQFIQDSAAPEDIPDGDDNDLPPAVAQRTVIAPTFEDECRKRELKNPMFSAAAESALSIGYSKATVKEAIMIYIERTGNRDFSAADLVERIFELEEQGRAFFSEDTDVIAEEDEFQLTPKAMKMENLYLKEKLVCVGCKERERCMLFIPCGHRITCGICSKEQTKCPKCLSEVTSAVKTFLG
ncbi:baculoviral IAP repeat-containing protein 2-like [Mizuhopecten yessoensis]|uniref:baculoviral IAP repeat-containing protein 2-like n=1 Tax=Mizuhopecten yessoensis TaxID=6573 RepID=UPI000B4587F7|nr:baculoviral IAP repeat-containing protein 2-like [Mizuhopecten yessoensis]